MYEHRRLQPLLVQADSNGAPLREQPLLWQEALTLAQELITPWQRR